MKKNRTIQISLARPAAYESAEGPYDQDADVNTVEVIGEVVSTLMGEAGKLLAAWVAMDTARKLILTLAAK